MVFPFDRVTAADSLGCSYVRFLNAAPYALSVLVNDTIMHRQINSMELSEYSKAKEGSYNIKVEINGIMQEFNAEIKPDKIYTYAITGDNELRPHRTEDVKRDVNNKYVLVRFINLSDEKEVDICLNSRKILEEIKHKDCSEYFTLPSKKYMVSVHRKGEKEPVLSASGIRLENGKHYSVYLTGNRDKQRLLITTEGSGYGDLD
jgi:hypothetical protein